MSETKPRLGPLEARLEFPTTKERVWLHHAGVSPIPERARRAVERAVRRMHEAPPRVWGAEAARDEAELRQAIGRLIGANTECITLTRSTAHGLSLLARGLDWRAGDNVVGVRFEYATNLVPWMALQRIGVELRLVDERDGRITPDAVFELVDDRTRVVALSFVQWWNGHRLDLARIGAECRKQGVVFAVDAIQGLGAIGFDVHEAYADLVATSAYKWLLGPSGIGFSYVSPELCVGLEPALVGVGSLAAPTPFDPVLDYAPTARRFEESGVSWLDVAGFLGSLSLIEDVGIDVIEERVLHLSQHAGQLLEERGYDLAPPWPRRPEESSAIISFRKQGTPSEELDRRLDAAGFAAKVRRDHVRFAPHFYNTDEEIERAVDALV